MTTAPMAGPSWWIPVFWIVDTIYKMVVKCRYVWTRGPARDADADRRAAPPTRRGPATTSRRSAEPVLPQGLSQHHDPRDRRRRRRHRTSAVPVLRFEGRSVPRGPGAAVHRFRRRLRPDLAVTAARRHR